MVTDRQSLGLAVRQEEEAAMAVRSADLRIPSRRSHAMPAAFAKLARTMNERHEARKALRKLMADRSVGRETGARI